MRTGGKMTDETRQRAERTWDILTERAYKNLRKIKYKALAEMVGTHPRACASYLSPIQEYCAAHNLPPLQSLVVSAATGKPGERYREALPLI